MKFLTGLCQDDVTTSSGYVISGSSLSEYDNVSNLDNVRKPLAHVTYLKCQLSKYYEALR